MTQRDALNTKNDIQAHKKMNFEDRKFFLRNWRKKKFRYNWKKELAKNVEYDSAWCAEYEKRYFATSKK